MTTATAAAALHRTQRRVCQLVAQGRLVGRREGRTWLVTAGSVTAELARRTT